MATSEPSGILADSGPGVTSGVTIGILLAGHYMIGRVRDAVGALPLLPSGFGFVRGIGKAMLLGGPIIALLVAWAIGAAWGPVWWIAGPLAFVLIAVILMIGGATTMGLLTLLAGLFPVKEGRQN